MKKTLILKIISCVLILALLWVVLTDSDDVFFDSGKIPEITDKSEILNDSSNTVKVSVNDVAVPDGLNMTPICKNGVRVLFANMETGEFAIWDQSIDKIWYSNPPDREDDPYFGADRPKVFSLMTLHCMNTETMVDEYLTSFGDSELENGVTVTTTNDGLLVEFNYVAVKITIPLKITLTNKGFVANVDVTDIKENDKYVAMDFTLLPYFGAGGVNDSGYLVVPDGSGALIHFNNEKHSMRKYLASIYGSDPVLSGETKGANAEYAALPLFGLKNGDNGFVAIISKGDAVASVTAGVSKSGSGYNNVSAGFLLRSSGSDIIGGKEIRTYEKSLPKVTNSEISYVFLSGSDANYVGMANVYRTYLENQIKSQTNKTRELSVFLELYGAIRVKESVLGMPAQVIKSVTTFEQAQKIVSDLKNKGVNKLAVLFQDADSASLYGEIPTEFSPISELGGEKQYKKLKSFLDNSNVALVSNINFTTFETSGNGFSTRTDTAELFTGLPGMRYNYKLNTGVSDEDLPVTYFLAPRLLESVVGEFSNKYDIASYGYIGLDTLAKDVYSDFAAKSGVGRQQMLSLSVKVAETLTQKGPLYVRNGNGRLLPYADYIYDMSSDISHYDMVDESVPIYQIAVSGLIPYSLEAVNVSTDFEMQFLKCVEYGADIKFNLSYENLGILGNALFGYLNGTQYDSWKDYIVQTNKRLETLNGKLGNGRIVAHEQASEDVFVTTYDNGTKVVVNYNTTNCMYSGVEVKAKDFAIITKGVES